MTKTSPSRLFIASAFLLQASAVHSAGGSAPLQVSMLTEKQDELHTSYSSPADKFNDSIDESVSVDAESISDTKSEDRLTEQQLATLRKLFLQAET